MLFPSNLSYPLLIFAIRGGAYPSAKPSVHKHGITHKSLTKLKMSHVPFVKSNEINSMTIFDISLSLPLSPSLSLFLPLSLPLSLPLFISLFPLSPSLFFSHKAHPHSKHSSFSQSVSMRDYYMNSNSNICK